MMSRIAIVVSSNVDSKVAATLSQLKASMGMVPNLFATMANAPVALDGYLALKKVLARGRLTNRQREILSLVVGQEDECQYCLSAHTQLSKAAGLSEADALKARSGDGDDPFEHALALFACQDGDRLSRSGGEALSRVYSVTVPERSGRIKIRLQCRAQIHRPSLSGFG
jgi:AhpD family alkylhydroperoxidase